MQRLARLTLSCLAGSLATHKHCKCFSKEWVSVGYRQQLPRPPRSRLSLKRSQQPHPPPSTLHPPTPLAWTSFFNANPTELHRRPDCRLPLRLSSL